MYLAGQKIKTKAYQKKKKKRKSAAKWKWRIRNVARKKGRARAPPFRRAPSVRFRRTATVCSASIVSDISSSCTSNAYHDGDAADPLYRGVLWSTASKMPVRGLVVAGDHECW